MNQIDVIALVPMALLGQMREVMSKFTPHVTAFIRASDSKVLLLYIHTAGAFGPLRFGLHFLIL